MRLNLYSNKVPGVISGYNCNQKNSIMYFYSPQILTLTRRGRGAYRLQGSTKTVQTLFCAELMLTIVSFR